METKFTKAKWIIKNEHAIYDSWSNTWFCVLINNKGEFVQKVNGITKEEAEANAKLIAAVPNLLEVLLYGHEISSKIQYPTNEELRMFTRMAALAIKKATE